MWDRYRISPGILFLYILSSTEGAIRVTSIAGGDPPAIYRLLNVAKHSPVMNLVPGYFPVLYMH